MRDKSQRNLWGTGSDLSVILCYNLISLEFSPFLTKVGEQCLTKYSLLCLFIYSFVPFYISKTVGQCLLTLTSIITFNLQVLEPEDTKEERGHSFFEINEGLNKGWNIISVMFIPRISCLTFVQTILTIYSLLCLVKIKQLQYDRVSGRVMV